MLKDLRMSFTLINITRYHLVNLMDVLSVSLIPPRKSVENSQLKIKFTMNKFSSQLVGTGKNKKLFRDILLY